MNKVILWLLLLAANISQAQFIGQGRRGSAAGGASSSLDTVNIVYKNRDANILSTLNFAGSPIFNQSNTSPLWKTVAGTLLTTPQAGAWEVSGDVPYYTINTGTARKQFVLAEGTLTSGRVSYNTTNGRQTDVGTFIFNTTTGGRLSVGTTSATSNLNVGATVTTSGNAPLATFTGAAHTGQTAATELNDVFFNLGRTVQFATGGITTQRAIRVAAPTYGFVGASTIGTAATLSVSGAPSAGSNATITNPYALWVESGLSRFENGISSGGSITGPTLQTTSNAVVGGALTVSGVITGNGSGITAIPYSTGLTGQPTIPTNADYVDKSTAQTGIAGAKTWTGYNVFNGGLASNGFGVSSGVLNIFQSLATTNTFAKFQQTTGNVYFQSPGASPAENNSGATFAHSITASSGLARGMTVTPTLTAAANNDQMIGLDIAPNFVPGAFTGTSSIGLRIAGDIMPLTSGSYSIGTPGTRFLNIHAANFASGGTVSLGPTVAAGGIGFRQGSSTTAFLVGGYFGTTGNAYDQAAGLAPTDNGYRRQIYGDLYVSGNQLINGQINSTQTATSAIMNITPGTLKTTAVAGDLEANGDGLRYTIQTGASRKPVILGDFDLTPGRVPFVSTNGRLADNGLFNFVTGKGGTLSVGTTSTFGNLNVSSSVQTSGTNGLTYYLAAAHTNQTASTEVIDNQWNSSANLQFATGNLSQQRTNLFTPRTYSAVGASTITEAVTVDITGAPIAGANMTLTNAYALRVGGTARFNNLVQIGSGGSLSVLGGSSLNTLTVGGTLGVTGATTLTSLTTSGNTTLGGTLNAAGQISNNSGGAYINGGTTVNGGLTVNNNMAVGGSATVGTLAVSSVPVYADNAAATTGGLAVGAIYRTSTGVLMIRY